jgi:hypothetical protein
MKLLWNITLNPSSATSSRGTKQSVHATHFLILNHPVSPIQNRGDLTRQYKSRKGLHEKRLLSDGKESKRIFITKVQQLFGPRKDAYGAYILEVSSSRVMQLNDLAPLAFMTKTFPELDPTNTGIENSPAKIRLNFVNLSLQTRVQFCANSSSGPQRPDHTLSKILSWQKSFEEALMFQFSPSVRVS